MRQFIASVINRISLKLNKISSVLYTSSHKKLLREWNEQEGEKKRLEYELSENSVVYDVGGYEGQWTSDIFSKYLCTVHIFEPVSDFAAKVKKRFCKNPRIFVHHFGLSDKNSAPEIAILDNSSSIFRKGAVVERIQLRDIREVLLEQNIKKLDLMKINIEGGEYNLLEKILESGFQRNIKSFQIQFHDIAPDSGSRMKRIKKELEKTHHLTYFFPFIWESWELNK